MSNEFTWCRHCLINVVTEDDGSCPLCGRNIEKSNQCCSNNGECCGGGNCAYNTNEEEDE